MTSMFDFDHFLEGFSNAASEDDLQDIMEELTHELGFSQFAMGHHVDLTRPPKDSLRLTSYRPAWISRVMENGYIACDPILAASRRSSTGFLWHDVGRLIALTYRQQRILAEARTFGLEAGLTVPVYMPGEYYGGCSFGGTSLDRMRRHALPLARMAATLAFEAARRVFQRYDGPKTERPPVLTPRQQETLVLVGRGKTDREIGAILGISRTTAHEHVESLRCAYGNAQRAYLVVRALFDGQITFAEVMRR